MGRYLLVEEFTSEVFEVVTTVFLSLVLVESFVFGFAHYYAILFNKMQIMESVRKVNMETMLYFGFNVIAGVPVGIAIIVVNPDSNKRTCNMLFSCSAFFIYFSNALLYRLLISRSTLYDPMSQLRRLSTATWWIIHLFYIPVLLYGTAATFIWSRVFIDVDGNQRCVERHSKATIIFLAVVDFAINICCIIVLAAPTIVSPATKEIKEVVRRVCSTMTIAMISTLLFYIYAALGSNGRQVDNGPDFYIVRIMLRLGAIDYGINFTMMVLSWPVNFYKAVYYESGKAVLSRFHTSAPGSRRFDDSRNRSQNRSHNTPRLPGSVGGNKKSFAANSFNEKNTENKIIEMSRRT
mmetsp:Transcript_20587/g.50499  ORF Transcript_20587/g.50499 Transcript_20587/m.50499 type:complete len:351 (+) Transcript_20587:278-1330(+)